MQSNRGRAAFGGALFFAVLAGEILLIEPAQASPTDQRDTAIAVVREQRDVGVLQYLANPRAAYYALRTIMETHGEHARSDANVRRMTALGPQKQHERTIFLLYLDSLKDAFRPRMQQWCERHGRNEPVADSLDEAYTLLHMQNEIHSFITYQQELARQMQRLMKTRAKTEGRIESANRSIEQLPFLLSRRYAAHPLQRELVFQTASHYSGMFFGIPAAIIAGGLRGIGAGIQTGFRKGGDGVNRYFRGSESQNGRP